MAETSGATGPDLSEGIPLSAIPSTGALVGRVGDAPVLLSRHDGELFAISATCTHYGGPLAEGLIVGETVRCPWHHACFSLRTGEALKAPAFEPVDRWSVEIEGEQVFVRTKLEKRAATAAPLGHPKRIVIVGGGAAGFAAAEMLRRRGYSGLLTMLSEDDTPPCDRPNLSKDYLAGSAPEAWVLLHEADYYRRHDIDLHLDTKVARIDAESRAVTTAAGETLAYDALLVATGAAPVRLATPGFDLPNVYTLRSLADAKAVIAAASAASRAVVIGASFIGLEVAAALRTRGLAVAVVAPERVPMEKVMGPEIGGFVRSLHERHGVAFHMGRTAIGFDGHLLKLDDGGAIEADLVIVGVGVKPRTELASAAGLAVDDGVLVDAHLETSVPGIYAAGDVASYPEPHSRLRTRIEHWVVAERQGQTVAANMLGERVAFTDVPFFWSRHYDTSIHYVGHARDWDEVQVDGSVADGDCTVRFLKDGIARAAASIGRDLENLREEVRLNRTESDGRQEAGIVGCA